MVLAQIESHFLQNQHHFLLKTARFSLKSTFDLHYGHLDILGCAPIIGGVHMGRF